MKAVKESHTREYKEKPQYIVCVPDVTTILGEFAYYSQGKVLMCANDRGLCVALSESTDSQVHILNTYTKDKKKFSLSSLKYRKEDKWGNYIKGIFFQLSSMGIALKSYNITIDGPSLKDGSSNLAALISIGVCYALNEALGLSLDAREMGLICHRNCTQYCNELYRYSTIMAALNAKQGKFVCVDMNTLSFSFIDDPFENAGYDLLQIDCRISQTAMREEFSHRHAAAKEAFEKLRDLTSKISLKDFPVTDLANRIIPLDETSRRICTDILAENSAMQMLQNLFLTQDYVQMGKVLSRVGKIIRDDMELTCPEIDWVVKRSSEIPECLGSFSILDGDNALVALILQASEAAKEKLKSKLEDYERIFGFKATISPVRPQGHCCLI